MEKPLEPHQLTYPRTLLVELVGAAWALGGCCWPLLYRYSSLSPMGSESWSIDPESRSGGLGAGRSGRFLAAIGRQPSRIGLHNYAQAVSTEADQPEQLPREHD